MKRKKDSKKNQTDSANHSKSITFRVPLDLERKLMAAVDSTGMTQTRIINKCLLGHLPFLLAKTVENVEMVKEKWSEAPLVGHDVQKIKIL